MKTNMNGFNMPKKLLMVALVLILAVVCVFAETRTVYDKDELKGAFDAGADKDIVLDSDFPIDESILLYSNNANLFLNCKSLTFKGEDACIDNSEGYRLDVYGGANAGASSISGSLRNGAGNTITIWVNDSASVVNIHSGTIEGIGINSGILNVLGGYVSYICAGNTVLNKYINISGGYIDGIVERPNTLISISGGYFSSEPQSSWIAGGYCVVANTDAGTKDQYPYKVVPPSITLSSASSFSVSSSEKGWSGTIYYKLGDGAWTAWDGSSITSSQEGGAGDYKIQFRGKNNNGTVSSGKAWSITGSNVKVSGNIMSLVDYEDVANATMGSKCFWALFKNNSAIVDISELSLPSMTLSDLCYCEMFMGCTGLTNISSLSLPATTLKYQCYMKMFANCSKLVTVMSTLPATSLASQCYSNMFNGCSELTTPPSLSATILADSCYESMFAYCSKLTSPPVLNATDLKRGCYYEMFAACTSLTRLPVLSNVATVSGAYACYSMFRGCSKIVLCTDGTGENWTLPSSVTGTNASGWTNNMFGPSGISVDGTSLQTPTAGQNYYYKFNVNISADSHGSVSATSIANISEPKTVTVSNNTFIINSTTITATPDSGYVFDEWVGIPADKKVVKNTSITAKFKALVTGVSLNKTTISLGVGETETLTATVVPDYAADKSVTWSSSNTSVATVDSTGMVTAVSGGSAIITVTTTDGGFEATCTVSVPHTHPSTAVGGEVSFSTPISNETELKALFSSGGSGYLAADITLTSNVSVGYGKTVKLCLNGYVLNLNGNKCIVVPREADFSIYDCGTTVHKFSVNSSTGLYSLDEANGTVSLAGGVITGATNSAIYDNSDDNNPSRITVYGGNFVGNESTNENYGGGVLQKWGSILTINGGKFIGNYVKGFGGVINACNTTGAVYINGGVFSNNYAARDGGAIASEASLTITGGEFNNNIAVCSGGAIWTAGKPFTMTGGKVIGNKSTTAAGISIGSDAFITGGEISGNKNEHFTSSYGYDDSFHQQCSGIRIATNNCVLGGSVKIYGNTNIDNETRNVHIWDDASFVLDSPVVGFHTSITSANGSDSISFTSTSATTTYDYSQLFDSEDPDYYIASVSNATSGTHGVLKKYLNFSPSVSGVNKTYDGTAYGITVNSGVAGATVMYGPAEGVYYLSDSPTYSNAGTYTVYYQITKDGYRPYSGSATVTINKATTMTVSGSNYNAPYDGQYHGTAASASVPDETAAKIEYSINDGLTWSTTVPQRKDIGTTTVKVRATNANYVTATNDYTITIAALSVPYVNASGVSQPNKDCTPITSSTTTLTTGWYVVNSTVSISDQLVVDGDVNIILADDATLTVDASSQAKKAGIKVSGNTNSLTIWGQSAGNGTIIAKGGSCGAGIGGATSGFDGTQDGENITINGGNVIATGGMYGAGIGGASRNAANGVGKNIIINAGKIIATGGSFGAGIGGAMTGNGENIIINGGDVTSIGGDRAAGIGGGNYGYGKDIIINGGTVTATGGQSDDNYGAGIGNGCNSDGSGSNNIKVGSGLVVRAGSNVNPTEIVANANPGTTDLAPSISGKQYVTVSAFKPVTGVTLNKSTTSLIYGETETLIATIAPADATVKTVTWSSSNESAATVDQTGKVTAIGVGSATITVTTTDGGMTATCSVTINPASTMTVAGKNYVMTYDGQSHGDAATVVVPDGTAATVEYSIDNGANWNTTVPQRKDFGTTTVKVRATNANYVTAEDSYTLTVTRKAVTVISDNKSKTYGAAEPVYTATVTGTIGTDTVSYTCTRESGDDIGEYTITPSGAAEQGNYSVTYKADGKLTINPVGTLTVSVNNYSGIYDGQSHGTAATASVETGTTVEYSTYEGSSWSTWSTTVPQRKDVGTTNVKVRATNSNYTTAVDSYSITVTAKAVTVTSENKSKTYDDADPALTATVAGLVGSDTVDYTVTRATGENVGTYTITPSGDAVQGNYSVSYVASGKLTINAKSTLTVSGSSYNEVYDGQLHGDAATVSVVDGTTVEYSTDNGSTWYTVVPQRKDIGTTTVKVRATNANYVTAESSYALTVTAKAVTVTSDNKSKLYGFADPELTATVTGLVGSDTVGYTVTRVSGSGVGNYTITPSGDAAQGNYTVAYVASGKLTINPATTMTVSVSNYSGTYDGQSHGDAATASVPEGTTVEYSTDNGANWSTTVPQIKVVGTTNVKVKATNANYVTAEDSYTLTVTRKAVTVTSDNKSKTYGSDNPTFTATVTGTIGTDTVIYSCTREAGDDIGEYVITPSGEAIQGNYTVTYVATGKLTVNAKAVTVTSDNKSKTYGDAEPTLTATVTGLVDGDTVAYTLARAEGENVGTYAITPSGDAVQGNYAVSYVASGKLTINAKSTLTVSGSSYNEVYDGQLHGNAATVSVVDGTTVEYSTDNGSTWYTVVPQRKDVGTTTVKVRATNANYVPAESSYALTVTAKAVTVTSDNKSKLYGFADPELTATVTGLVGSDTVDYTVTRVSGSNVGDYTITPSGDAAQGNYTVTYVASGKLSINPATTMTVSVSNYSGTYDGQFHGDAATASVPEGTTVEYSTDNGASWATDVPQRTDVGTTTVKVKATNSNYVTAEDSYTLTVTRKAVTVTSDNKSKAYGTTDPEFTATVAGTVGTETVSYSFARKAGENIGEYTITPSGAAEQGNYTVTYVASGKLKIDLVTMTVTGSNYSGIYDGQSHGDAATVTITAGTTVEYSTDGGATWSTTVPQRKDVGTTNVKVRATNPNYVTDADSYTLTVTAKAVTVTSDNKSKTYDDADPALTATVNGTIGSDNVSYTLSREVGESVGNYTITPSGAAVQGNYYVTYVAAGKLTIGPKAVANVALNKDKTSISLGGDETLTATVSPDNATDKSVTWTSSNAAVATVDQNGKVSAVGLGNATITVTTTDGSMTDSCEVTVKKHVHVWHYSTSAAGFIAECTGTGTCDKNNIMTLGVGVGITIQ